MRRYDIGCQSDSPRAEAWDRYAARAIRILRGVETTAYIAERAAVMADALLAERDKRFTHAVSMGCEAYLEEKGTPLNDEPREEPVGRTELLQEREVSYAEGLARGQRDERERVIRLAEEWWGNNRRAALDEFAEFLRTPEGKP